MSKGDITMSQKESIRIAVVDKVIKKSITAKEGASQLRLSERQVKRLVKRYRAEGVPGLISKKRGQPSNNKLSQALYNQSIALVREQYIDFGPTFAAEKLREVHDLHVSRETLRQWMIAEEIWSPKRSKTKVHKTRARRASYGDMIQIDGSPHDWFEGRGPYCSLLVFIDDATSALMALKFMPSETTFGYLDCLRSYIDDHGLPVSLYSDKHSIFRQNHNNAEGEETQFTKALRALEIEPIHANTPQAKGRVERANKTLQDRLVREMRLRNINDMEAANKFLPEFIEDYNKRFAKEPLSSVNAHREPVHTAQALDLICAVKQQRTLSKNLTLQFKNNEYQLDSKHHQNRLKHKKINIIERSNGELFFQYEQELLTMHQFTNGTPPIPLDDEKTLDARITEAKIIQKNTKRKPSPSNPFNRSRADQKPKRRSKTLSRKNADYLARYV